MPDPTTDRITELLAAHYYCESARGPWRWCYCGLGRDDNGAFTPAIHRAHVASLLAVLVADAQTDAWREGAVTVYEDWSEAEGPFLDDVEDTFPNPYREATSG